MVMTPPAYVEWPAQAARDRRRLHLEAGDDLGEVGVDEAEG